MSTIKKDYYTKGMIYGLIDPRYYPLVRYVGQTVHTLECRFNGHKKTKIGKRANYHDYWIQKLRSLKVYPVPIKLEDNIPITFITWLQNEHNWIPTVIN